MTTGSGRRLWRVLCIVWLAVIFGQSLLPAELSQAESGLLLARLDITMLTDYLLRKFAHFFEFAVLGFLLARCLEGPFVRPGLAALLCGLADETVQLFVPGRSGQITDVWIDFAGAALAIALTLWTRKRARRKRGPDRPGPGS